MSEEIMNNFANFEFKTPLVEGLIKSRPNRFIMNTEVNNNIEKCHCPTTGKIGNIVFKDVPCLLSKSENIGRKTPYTVEAFLREYGKKDQCKSWIGINQTAVNRYVEHFLRAGLFNDAGEPVLREQTLGSSRLDFRVGRCYIEVKMPLFYLFSKTESLNGQAPTSLDRFIRHVGDLRNSLKDNCRAILLTCFMFDAPRFVPPAPSDRNIDAVNTVKQSLARGVEIWQLNLAINQNGVDFVRCFDISSTVID
ncbi:MAG: DNA/RNA nuclease SfsA [Holosporaceae bacterium]|jgi:sugar fermentation stimulation protein A|nr:DNA/RNA nuclease SfsA [Holosporaceae bacterium]